MRDKLLLSFQVARVFQKTGYFSVSEQIHADCMSMIGFRRDKTWKLSGLVVSGVRKASFFTQLDWVKKQMTEKVGFEPFPGTLNLRIEEEPFKFFLKVKERGEGLVPPDPSFCEAKIVELKVEGIDAVAVFPSEDVWCYRNTLEIMAPVNVRKTLGVKDGDLLTIFFQRTFRPGMVIFDLVGTIIEPPEAFSGLEGEERRRLIPHVEEAMRGLKDRGIKIGVVTSYEWIHDSEPEELLDKMAQVFIK